MGSKNGICNQLIRIFPKAENFYDVFGGGFSVTHAMLLRRPKDYEHFYFNEIKSDVVELIKDAIAGNYSYKQKPKFITREEFFARKDKDAYVRCIWSFGNNQRGYLFSKQIEPYKRSMHNAIVFNEFDSLAKQVLGMDRFANGYSINDRRLFLASKIEFYRKTKIPDILKRFLKEKQLQQLERLQQLQQLERLQQLEQLERLEQLVQLTFTSQSYEKLQIKQNSIIYCDPPYEGTADYGNQFDHEKFLDWAHAQREPVFISEYDIKDPRFKVVSHSTKRSMLHSNKDKCVDKTEKVYANEAGVRAIFNRRQALNSKESVSNRATP
jgi:site-specific DNA-adenine methylase